VPLVFGPSAGGEFGAVADSELPWALPASMPAGQSSESGGFDWLPVNGDRVWVRFLDGEPEKPLWEWGTQNIEGAAVQSQHRSYKGQNEPSRRGALTRFGHIVEFLPTQVMVSTKTGYSFTAIDAGTELDGYVSIRTPKGNSFEISDADDSLLMYLGGGWQALFTEMQFLGQDFRWEATKSINLACDGIIEMHSGKQLDITSAAGIHLACATDMSLEATTATVDVTDFTLTASANVSITAPICEIRAGARTLTITSAGFVFS